MKEMRYVSLISPKYLKICFSMNNTDDVAAGFPLGLILVG